MSRIQLLYAKIILTAINIIFLINESHFHQACIHESHVQEACNHGHHAATDSVWPMVLFLCAGYGIGKLTCSKHLHGFGWILTIILFCGLNGLHSMIDGISLLTITLKGFIFVILPHELIRQPMLYARILSIMNTFKLSMWIKLPIAAMAVTGTWILGVSLGTLTGEWIHTIEWIHSYLAGSSFLLAGDMIHHLRDEFKIKPVAH